MRVAIDHYNFPKSHHDVVHSVYLSHVGSLLKENGTEDNTETASQETDKSTSKSDAVGGTAEQDGSGVSSDSKLKSDQKGLDGVETNMEVCEGTVAKDAAEEKSGDVVQTTAEQKGAKEWSKGKGKRKIETVNMEAIIYRIIYLVVNLAVNVNTMSDLIQNWCLF